MKLIRNNIREDETSNIGVKELRNVACLQHLTNAELADMAEVIVRFTEIACGVFKANNQDDSLAPVINININHPKIKAA